MSKVKLKKPKKMLDSKEGEAMCVPGKAREDVKEVWEGMTSRVNEAAEHFNEMQRLCYEFLELEKKSLVAAEEMRMSAKDNNFSHFEEKHVRDVDQFVEEAYERLKEIVKLHNKYIKG